MAVTTLFTPPQSPRRPYLPHCRGRDYEMIPGLNQIVEDTIKRSAIHLLNVPPRFFIPILYGTDYAALFPTGFYFLGKYMIYPVSSFYRPGERRASTKKMGWGHGQGVRSGSGSKQSRKDDNGSYLYQDPQRTATGVYGVLRV